MSRWRPRQPAHNAGCQGILTNGTGGGRTRSPPSDRVGNRQTYRNAKRIVLASREEPEKYGRLVEQMDKSEKVDGAFRELGVDRGGRP